MGETVGRYYVAGGADLIEPWLQSAPTHHCSTCGVWLYKDGFEAHDAWHTARGE